MRAPFLALALALAFTTAHAATLPATPATAAAVFTTAQPGDTVVLGAGDYVGLTFKGRSFSPALKVDARAATLHQANIFVVSGLEVTGGTWKPDCPAGPCYTYALRISGSDHVKVAGGRWLGAEQSLPGQMGAQADGYAIKADTSSALEITDHVFSGFRSTVVLDHVNGFTVSRNRFSRMRSDGLDIAQSWHGLVEDNVCDATRILGGEHPDCIQMWSRPNAAPTSDITIRRTWAIGDTQGVFGGNKAGRIEPAGYVLADGTTLAVATATDDGGFDRLVIEDNVISGGFPNGIEVVGARGLVLRNNRISTVPGSLYPSRISAFGTDITRCGNTVAGYGGMKAVIDAPCPAAP